MPACDHFDDPNTCKFCAPRDVVIARFEAEGRRLRQELADFERLWKEDGQKLKDLAADRDKWKESAIGKRRSADYWKEHALSLEDVINEALADDHGVTVAEWASAFKTALSRPCAIQMGVVD